MFVCAVLAFELALSLWQHRDTAKAWLLLWAVVATVLYGCHWAFFQRLTAWQPLTDSIYVACNLAVYPLYLIYIYKLTDERPLPRRSLLGFAAYVLSALLLVAGVVGLYAAMSPAELKQFLDCYLYSSECDAIDGLPMVQAFLHNACKLLFTIGVVAVVVAGGRRLRRYNHLVDQLYADTDDKSLRRLSVTLVWFLLIAVVSLVVNALGRQWFVTGQGGVDPWLAVTSVLFSLLLCAIGWLGMQQQFSMADMLADARADGDEALQSADTESGETKDDRVQTTVDAFVSLMDSEQLYLRPSLRLNSVAVRLNTNRTYLLQALNAQLGMTFSEFVNRRRIAYACQLMAQDAGMTRLEVGAACGYNSPTTFYRNYRKYADEYRVEELPDE